MVHNIEVVVVHFKALGRKTMKNLSDLAVVLTKI